MTENRYEFVALFGVGSGDPSGDPDVDSLPGINPKSGYDIMTDVRLEHKVHNYVETLKRDEPRRKIYTREDALLNKNNNIAYIKLKADEKGIKELKRRGPQVDQKIRDFMYHNFFDIRTFEAVMITFVKAALNCGQVRGPVQLDLVRSIDPIVSQKVTTTRVAITTEKGAEDKSAEIGRENIAPYALYHTEGYISANLARKSTGFSEEDLELLWGVIINIFEADHSIAKGEMAMRRLIVFRHSKGLGDCPAHKLFGAVEVRRNEDVGYPRKCGDYTVAVHRNQIPETVEVSEKI